MRKNSTTTLAGSGLSRTENRDYSASPDGVSENPVKTVAQIADQVAEWLKRSPYPYDHALGVWIPSIVTPDRFYSYQIGSIHSSTSVVLRLQDGRWRRLPSGACLLLPQESHEFLLAHHPWSLCPDCTEGICHRHTELAQHARLTTRTAFPVWAAKPYGGDPNEHALDFKPHYQYSDIVERITRDALEHPHLPSADPWIKTPDEWADYGPLLIENPRWTYEPIMGGYHLVEPIAKPLTTFNVRPGEHEDKNQDELFLEGFLKLMQDPKRTYLHEHSCFGTKRASDNPPFAKWFKKLAPRQLLMEPERASEEIVRYEEDGQFSRMRVRAEFNSADVIRRIRDAVQSNLGWLPTLLSNSYSDEGFVYGVTFDAIPEGDWTWDYDKHCYVPPLFERVLCPARPNVGRAQQAVEKLREDYEAHLRVMAWTPALQAKWEARLLKAGLPKEVAPSDTNPDADDYFHYEPEQKEESEQHDNYVSDAEEPEQKEQTAFDESGSHALASALSGSRGDNDDVEESAQDRHMNNGTDYHSHFNQRQTTNEINDSARELKQLLNGIRRKFKIEGERTDELKAAILGDPDSKSWKYTVKMITEGLSTKELKQQESETVKENTLIKQLSRATQRLEEISIHDAVDPDFMSAVRSRAGQTIEEGWYVALRLSGKPALYPVDAHFEVKFPVGSSKPTIKHPALEQLRDLRKTILAEAVRKAQDTTGSKSTKARAVRAARRRISDAFARVRCIYLLPTLTV